MPSAGAHRLPLLLPGNANGHGRGNGNGDDDGGDGNTKCYVGVIYIINIRNYNFIKMLVELNLLFFVF